MFASGRYRPDTLAGATALAHELTHVVQQRRFPQPLSPAEPDDAAEHEAGTVALRVLAGQRAPTIGARAPQVARLADPDEGKTTDPAATPADEDGLDGGGEPGGPVLPVPATPDQPAASPSELAVPESAPDELAGGAPQQKKDRTHLPVPAPSKSVPWITSVDIDLAQQALVVKWSDHRATSAADKCQISSGGGRHKTKTDPCLDQRSPHCTPEGTFSPAFRGDVNYVNKDGQHMSWYVDLGTGRGIGIHDAQPVTGRPVSHGCVRVPAAMAEMINEHVTTQTVIHIQGKAPTRPW